MKTYQIWITTLFMGLIPSFAQAEDLGPKTYHVSCEKSTRTYVSHVSLSFNETDTLKYSFFYSYDLYELGPKAVSGLIAPGGEYQYPTLSKVIVSDEADSFQMKAKSQVVGGRNPHLQSVELKMEKLSSNTYHPTLLLINGVDYSRSVGACQLSESPTTSVTLETSSLSVQKVCNARICCDRDESGELVCY